MKTHEKKVENLASVSLLFT